MVSKEFDVEQSHPLEVEETRVYGFWKSKRRGDEKENNGFRIIIAQTRGGMCYRHNLARPEGGPRSKMGSKHNRGGLANRPLRGRWRPGLAMYLDRCVRLK
jgi:hypothetical protein